MIIRFTRRHKSDSTLGMSPPTDSPPLDLDRLSHAELKDLVLQLLAKVADLNRTVVAQRDEIARLKGGPGRRTSSRIASRAAWSRRAIRSRLVWTHDYTIFAADAVKLDLRSPPRCPMKSSLPEGLSAPLPKPTELAYDHRLTNSAS